MKSRIITFFIVFGGLVLIFNIGIMCLYLIGGLKPNRDHYLMSIGVMAVLGFLSAIRNNNTTKRRV